MTHVNKVAQIVVLLHIQFARFLDLAARFYRARSNPSASQDAAGRTAVSVKELAVEIA